jgi:hypothetical protein
MLGDAADEMVLETAVKGRADRLVTFKARHFENAAKGRRPPAGRGGVIAGMSTAAGVVHHTIR